MRVFLVLSSLFSAAICASLIHKSKESLNFKEPTALLLRDSKDVGPEQLNRWLGKAVPLAECTNLNYTDPDGGIISSPNYPGVYSDRLSCTYLIDLRSSADTVLLKFLDFETESGFDLTVIERQWIFNSSPSEIKYPSDVRYVYDGSISGYNGFLATYSNGGTTGCGKTYTNITGNIESVNYPDNYEDDQDCRYIIDLQSFPGASSVKLTFLDFQTEGGIDVVRVYEGLTTSGALLLTASGSTIPAPVVSRTSQILVVFTTDRSVNFRGFSANYEGI